MRLFGPTWSMVTMQETDMHNVETLSIHTENLREIIGVDTARIKYMYSFESVTVIVKLTAMDTVPIHDYMHENNLAIIASAVEDGQLKVYLSER